MQHFSTASLSKGCALICNTFPRHHCPKAVLKYATLFHGITVQRLCSNMQHCSTASLSRGCAQICNTEIANACAFRHSLLLAFAIASKTVLLHATLACGTPGVCYNFKGCAPFHMHHRHLRARALVGLPQSGRHVSISSSMPASQPSGAPAAQQPEPPVEKDATLQKLAQGKDFGCFDDGAPWFGWAAGH
eukprot:1157305-Pelagomonas_calceolata.AAC.6